MRLKKTVLLKDTPTTSDAFGTHKKIADLLHQEIIDSNEGRSIALVGDWGSGKSSVVEILKDELDRNSNVPTHVFIYDAWSHQGDSLRRAFLDDFTASLKKFLSEEQRLDAVRRVWNRTETTTTTREPILRRHAKVMLLSLAAVPLGMEFFQLPSNGGDIPWCGLFLWNNIVALVLIAAPLLFALLFGVVNRWVKNQNLRKFFFGDSYKDLNFSVLSFFFEKVQGDVERKEIKSPVDSIGTFREVFSQIVNDVHACRNDLRIVIVIDNIDRIPAEEAREFWSTMQTFFSDGGGLRQPRSMKYWLIAPFSVEALAFIFGDGALAAFSAKNGNLAVDEDRSHNGDTSATSLDKSKIRAKAYIDKTFGLAFYVPPPILSNWRKYFVSCLKEAFVEHDASDLKAVRDVYDFGRTGIGFVTPRDIKLFVNSLVALYRQRGDEIPLTMMASYLLHREEIVGASIPDDLIGPQEHRAIGVMGWKGMMAALHFGVQLEEGAQLLLHEPLVQALREGSNEDLLALEARPGFTDVLRKVVVDELGTKSANDGTVVAQYAEKLGALEYAGKPDAVHIWRDVAQSVRSVQTWSGLQVSPADGIAELIGHTRDTERLELCNSVARSLSKAQPLDTEDAQNNLTIFAKNWALTAKAVVDGSGLADGFEISIPRDPNFALEIVKQLSVLGIEPPALSVLKVKTPAAELSKTLAADIRKGDTISSPEMFTAFVGQAIPEKFEWPEIGTAVTERMQVTDLSEAEVKSHLGLLLSACGFGLFPGASGIMRDLSHQGWLSHFYQLRRRNNDIRGLTFIAMLLANPSMDRPSHTGESQQGDAALIQLVDAEEPDAELTSIVAEIAQRFDVADALYQIGARNQKVARFLAAVIGSLAKSGYQFGIAAETVMEHWTYIEEHDEQVPAKDFLECLKGRRDLLAFVASQQFDIERVGFYRATTEIATDQDSAYWTFLEMGILGIGIDDWQSALTEKVGPHLELVELVRDLNRAGLSVHLQIPAKDAVLAFVRAVVSGGLVVSQEQRERLVRLIELLQDGYRDSLARDMTDDMMGLMDADQLIWLVDLAGEEITLERESDPERIVRRVFSPLVSKPTERTIAWMNGVIECKGAPFWSVPDAAKEEFETKLRASIENGEEQDQTIRSSVIGLASHFDIDLNSQETDGDELEPL